MKLELLKLWLQWLAFWLLLFLLGRLVFIAIIFSFGFAPPAQWPESILHSLRLDISMASYFLLLPWLLTGLFFFLSKKAWSKAVDGIFIVVLLLNAFITIGEACLYTEWKSKLTAQALTYLTTPDEVAKSANLAITITFLGLSLGLFLVSVWVYFRFFRLPSSFQASWKWAVPQWLLGCAALLVGVRGGFQNFPISRSDAVFSTNPVLNDLAINPAWNLAKDCLEYYANNRSNPYIEMPEDQAQAIVDSLYYIPKDTSISILSQARPNVVFIILESWTAYASKSLGGDSFTPFFDSLAQQGLLFTRCYSNGYISDQGMPAILSSQPCTRRMSLINQTQKARRIPCINEVMKANGYQTGFLFGGDLNYGDMKSYILSKGFDVVLDEKNVPPSPNKSKLGTNDWEMATIVNRKIAESKTPFFHVWYTLSSHSPFDIPDPIESLTPVENLYINSIRFSDKALGRFFQIARTQAWYNNTLFVLVSDHSHYNHRQIESHTMEYHRIPFLLMGPALRPEWKGKTWDKVVSQLDITPSILAQLKFDRSAFFWGKNIFNPYTKPSAFFTLYFGSGLVEEDGYVSFSQDYSWYMGTDIPDTNRQELVARHGKAMQQRVFDDYLKR
ncbi:MAG: LTA synthase family protein [Bacteroidia bacterium]|nr:LTA synthase family protein [Bacteroidia bacterium]